MSIIQSVTDFMKMCPELKDGYFRVDSLGNRPTEYTIESMPCDPWIERYVGGGGVKQFLFALGSREYYSVDSMQNIENLEFYEKLSEWLEECNQNGDLPDLGDGKATEEIEIVSTGFLYGTDGKTARYQIQLRLTYEKEE